VVLPCAALITGCYDGVVLANAMALLFQAANISWQFVTVLVATRFFKSGGQFGHSLLKRSGKHLFMVVSVS
jgi:hypothetical protein